MFAHQVIEDLENVVSHHESNYFETIYKCDVNQVLSKLKNSVFFYVGKNDDVCELFKSDVVKHSILFEDHLGEYIKPPYPTMCLMSEHDQRVVFSNSPNETITKRCMLIETFPVSKLQSIKHVGLSEHDIDEYEKDYVFGIRFIHYYKIKKHWSLLPHSVIITPGHKIHKLDNGEKSSIIKLVDRRMGFESDTLDDLFDLTNEDCIIVNFTLMLLNCKNIGTETVHAPVKLNNKRKKAGKQPIFTYKTLVIKPVGKKQESIPKHLWNNRIHLARGHFKTYTAEKPLFGKITGRFWWQPAVRGRNRDGVVMKDYEVQTS